MRTLGRCTVLLGLQNQGACEINVNMLNMHSMCRGDEHSVVSDEVKEEKPAIPDDFYYDYDELVSKPFISRE